MFKNLKSLFIVEEEKTDNKPVPATPENTDNPANPAVPPPLPPTAYAQSNTPPIPATSGPGGSLDQRIFDSLQQAIEDNNIQGFDFFEFKHSLKTLEGIIPDEPTRFKSAFATAATMGVTVDKLIESANFYKNVLENERNNFQKALSQQVDLNVTAKQKDVERLSALIQQKSAEIARLTNEIAAHQEEMAKAQSIITESTTKIETTKNNFNTTLEIVLNDIQSDIHNIERYLRTR